MLGQPLDFAPGARTVYSNFGYMLLGLIVERVTGRGYTDYARAVALEPTGIRAMVNGAGRTGYVPGQARRYDPVGQLYGIGGLAARHFASAAWIGSAVDVARFMAAIGGSRPPRLLTPATWHEMLEPPPPPIPLRPDGGHFGMGWDVVQRTAAGALYHKDGLVTGATTWMEHDPRGVDWVLLFNANKGRPRGAELHRELQRRVREAIAATGHWPDIDLFDRFR
jgi:N-acyl-D-amino-acid deacylase